ncbi:MAG: hypothetical protein WD077_05340 [Bacteroidia bacterium]
MNLNKEIDLLRKQQQGPYVSIIAPMKMVFPESKQNSIGMKTLIQKTEKELERKFGREQANKLMENIQGLEKDIDYQHTLNGVGIFATPSFSRIVHIPYKPDERIVIDDHSFELRDLVYATNRLFQYWVLNISEDPVRLFMGYGYELQEIMDEKFPTKFLSPSQENVEAPTPHAREKGYYKDKYMEKFIHEVDNNLFDYLKNDSFPLIVMGTTKPVSYFKEHAKSARYVIETIEGKTGSKPVHELRQALQPVVDGYIQKTIDENMARLREAIGKKKVSQGLREAWRAVSTGNVDTLLVEEGYHHEGYLGEDGFDIALSDNGRHNGRMADAVDDLIEMVLDKGGKIVFVSAGRLEEFGKVALIKRYFEEANTAV